MSGSTSNNTVIGSGSDSIVLNISEDQAQGENANFTVNVDGQQIGGPQTTTASHSAGQDQTFTFLGNYAPGPHAVTVTFANNFIYPGLPGDRNLYVDGVTYNGQVISNSTTPIYQSPLFPPNSTQGDIYGNAVFTVNDTTPVPAGASSTPTTTPGAVSVGDGSDTLVLNMAEDEYLGDAQFTVSVDGRQIGGVQTTTAIVGEGQQQEFDVHGNFGGGTHSVSVDFLNDQIGAFYPQGTPGIPPGQWAVDTTDRNLYVMGASLDGGNPADGPPYEQSSDGTYTFNVTAGSNPGATGASSNNATVNSTTLAAGQSAGGISFVAPATTTTAASGGGTSASTNTTTTAPTLSSTLTSATTAAPDPTVTPATTSDPTTTASGSGGHHWTYQQNNGGTWVHQHG
jgi:hypothetical protein